MSIKIFNNFCHFGFLEFTELLAVAWNLKKKKIRLKHYCEVISIKSAALLNVRLGLSTVAFMFIVVVVEQIVSITPALTDLV